MFPSIDDCFGRMVNVARKSFVLFQCVVLVFTIILTAALTVLDLVEGEL